ncbi:hypothetical protein [Phenylobacterium sp. SCN 70-31]|uniref:hypothetical protein n=1 Tax=Phenylobacterium sp. SCN 70-31 TaxID=1660129 RepID=UPI00086B3D3D|nr:hypothetical protein [Phenylobacterium sp. SCN 70-31]ODT87802.1 MAG: hypothetical protein ABS78_10590 [Phenylobacterium sp. SCN 70-31]
MPAARPTTDTPQHPDARAARIPSPPAFETLDALGVAVARLWATTPDLDDPAQEAAYYNHADGVLAAIVATPARDFADAQVKAEAVAWCCASRTDFGLGDTKCERVISSLLRDLLQSPPSENTGMADAARIERLILDDPKPTRTLHDLAAAWVAVQAKIASSDAAIRNAQDEAEALYSPDPPGGRYGQRDTAERAFWRRQANAIDASVGLPSLNTAAEDLYAEANAIAAQVRATQPVTIEEAAIKFGLILADVCDSDGKIDNSQPVYDFLADLEHLARCARQS